MFEIQSVFVGAPTSIFANDNKELDKDYVFEELDYKDSGMSFIKMNDIIINCLGSIDEAAEAMVKAGIHLGECCKEEYDLPYGTSGDTSSSENDDPDEFCIALESTIQVGENSEDEKIEGFKVILVNTTPNTNYPMKGLAKVLNVLTT